MTEDVNFTYAQENEVIPDIDDRHLPTDHLTNVWSQHTTYQRHHLICV